MNLWIIKRKKPLATEASMWKLGYNFEFLVYFTRKKAREDLHYVFNPKNYEIVKFVQEEPKKQIKPRKDGFRYFEVQTINNRILLYRANKERVEFSTNNVTWETSDNYKNIKQLLKNSNTIEITW